LGDELLPSLAEIFALASGVSDLDCASSLIKVSREDLQLLSTLGMSSSDPEIMGNDICGSEHFGPKEISGMKLFCDAPSTSSLTSRSFMMLNSIFEPLGSEAANGGEELLGNSIEDAWREIFSLKNSKSLFRKVDLEKNSDQGWNSISQATCSPMSFLKTTLS
jgi:hypothetical protein